MKTRFFLWSVVLLRVVLLFNLDQHTYWTFDEPWNTDTAKQVLDEKQFRRTKDSFTPISIVNVYVGQKLMAIAPKIDKLTSYRVAGIILNQASVPLSYFFALELGASASIALLFTTFLAFEPNVLGHTVLASNVDGYILTWFLLLGVAALIWARKKTYSNLIGFGLALGLAQGVKLTSAYAVPLSLLWFLYVLRKENFKNIFLKSVVFLFFSWLGLCIFYAFNKLGTPLGEIHFVSKIFQHIATRFPRIPTILPVDYLQGLDMCLQTDTSPRPVYIRNTFLLHGVWYYFIYVLLLKTPIPLLFSSVAGWIRGARQKIFNAPHLFVGIFITGFMIYFSFFFNAQIGMRYLFPIYSFLLVGLIWFPWRKTSIVVASLWMACSFFYNWPNLIGYFNEFVPVKHHRWWHLGDSNLTWNQEWKDWPRFIGQSSFPWEQVGPPSLPVGIPFYEDAITVSGVLSNRQQLEVLRDHFPPKDSFWGVKLKYFLTPEEVLAQFPPLPFASTGENPLPCVKSGWSTEDSGQEIVDTPVLSTLPLGVHTLKSKLIVKSAGAIFFELASTKPARLILNRQEIISLNSPGPGLDVKTLSLGPGAYDVSLYYEKTEQNHYASVRAYLISSATVAETLSFCEVKP